jgi:hypothetical protein
MPNTRDTVRLDGPISRKKVDEFQDKIRAKRDTLVQDSDEFDEVTAVMEPITMEELVKNYVRDE